MQLTKNYKTQMEYIQYIVKTQSQQQASYNEHLYSQKHSQYKNYSTPLYLHLFSKSPNK